MNKRHASKNKMTVSIDSGPVYHRSGKERDRQEAMPGSLQAAKNDETVKELQRPRWQGNPKTKSACMEVPFYEIMKQGGWKVFKEKDDVTLDSGPVYHRSGKERRPARGNTRRRNGRKMAKSILEKQRQR